MLQAIELEDYEEDTIEPELRPEYIEKAKRIMKQRVIHVGTSDNLRRLIKKN